MTDEMKMWIGLGIFFVSPVAIMGVAWIMSLLPNDRPS